MCARQVITSFVNLVRKIKEIVRCFVQCTIVLAYNASMYKNSTGLRLTSQLALFMTLLVHAH